MAMLDITVGSIECKLNNENCSFLGKIKYILKFPFLLDAITYDKHWS